jgi:hypothetical protein
MILFFLLLLLTTLSSDVSSFTVTTATTRRIIQTLPSTLTTTANSNGMHRHHHRGMLSSSSASPLVSTKMTKGDDEGSGGGMSGTSITAGILFFIFAIGAVLPLVGTLDMVKGGGMSIADSVVTRQDAPGKLQNVEKKEFSLSRSAIQEKLNAIPVFYIATPDNNMSTDIYLSYEDANKAAAGSSTGTTVKGTTLDQVMYPLVLKRGRMRMAPPPSEVERAEGNLLSNNEKSYFLIPSTKAIEQYKEFNVGDLSNSDIPLFIADRLAFASPKGPQLPLFLDKSDCIASYQRLRNGKSSLPEEPTIRTSSLLETLITMEKGTRPGVNQLAFYATEQDLTKVAELQ